MEVLTGAETGAVEATVFYYMFITLAQNVILTGLIGDLFFYSDPGINDNHEVLVQCQAADCGGCISG